ncbi:MAG: hypothetical protein GTO45_08080 [Candidatus Aminicenantes bacterium]|nr:hypothetical protein [Candidatus Aminicenantes bacterium]NIM78789.1 hypothetical protein [Candidatus Aminicenantes bacterium]NIN18044.1 hypothetical protein [Candidatus Aminicenantes bacterium]NIN41944.1 hypothetical protein [Candidatus Aminicenantes bacterium]NIN84699.1 hypothetical protein [Candidatus Aminicenantes bacterium]
MKPKRLQKKLVLNKKTVANLDSRHMKRLYGGDIAALGNCISIDGVQCQPSVPECITDPPTLCGCPMSTQQEPCYCKVPIATYVLVIAGQVPAEQW